MVMILIYFLSGGCVDYVVNYQTNHQFTSIIVVHFMNSARMCWIIRRSVFNMKVCLNHTTNLKGVMMNQDIKGSFFKI